MKGPMMKVAQMLATIPEALPADYAERTDAPAVAGAADGRRFRAPAHAGGARARLARALLRIRSEARGGGFARPGPSRGRLEGECVACKLQYPEMASAVEADLAQLDILFSLHRRMGAAIDTREIAREIGARVREELDYGARPRSRGSTR